MILFFDIVVLGAAALVVLGAVAALVVLWLIVLNLARLLKHRTKE